MVAEEVVIRGRVIGSVYAPKVTLCSKCYVEGDLFHRGLTIEQGAFFDGMSGRCEDRLTSVPNGTRRTSKNSSATGGRMPLDRRLPPEN